MCVTCRNEEKENVYPVIVECSGYADERNIYNYADNDIGSR